MRPTWRTLCDGWSPQPQQPTPLEALRAVVRALETDQPVPAPAGRLVAAGLRMYLDGKGRDITRNLGLRPGRGGRHKTYEATERRARKAELVRQVFDGQDADTQKARARGVVAVLAVRDGSAITDEEMAAAIVKLQAEFGTELPRTESAVLRLLKGEQDA